MTKPKTRGQKALAAFARARRDTVLVTEDHLVDKSRAARIQRREEVINAMSPKRRNKHGNNVSYDAEGKWDSDAEKRRWPILKAMQKDGQIFGLQRQVRIPLHATTYNGVVGEHKVAVGVYVADFVYSRKPDSWGGEGKVFKVDCGFVDSAVVEDVKGQRTEMFGWKARHFKIEYGFSITEIKA